MKKQFPMLHWSIAALAALLPSCASEQKEDRLTYEMLMEGFDAVAPLAESALTIPDDSALPEHLFEGRLELLGEATGGGITVLRSGGVVDPQARHLPELDIAFVQRGGYLIPVQRGLVIAEHPVWNYFIEPGRVWQKADDQGLSRASFPFALTWKGSNGTLNGTMTFLFDERRVSKVWYQITQETTVSFSADLWGLLDATYHPGPVTGAEAVAAAFAAEQTARFPTRPIEALAAAYPAVDLAAFGAGVTPENMTWYGVVVDGVNYVGGCETRYGRYPYCDSMRAPSYSTAKSAFASVALMRLAKKYDPAAPALLIKDYVPEAAQSAGDWTAVTFDHVLDMGTGNFSSAAHMVDEENWDHPFWSSDYYTDKIAAAFSWPHSALPGTQWVYHTSDTFIVTRAMTNYLARLEEPAADAFQFVVDEVYKPLKLGPGVFSTLRTRDDNWLGEPYGGSGLWWVPDDLAKIATLLAVDRGAVDGEQLLDSELLAAALQRNPADRGLETSWGQYNNGFWAERVDVGCEAWVALMLGYSGIVVALMPNGIAYYYASDNREFTWDAAVQAADQIKPFCVSAAGTGT